MGEDIRGKGVFFWCFVGWMGWGDISWQNVKFIGVSFSLLFPVGFGLVKGIKRCIFDCLKKDLT